MNYTRTVGTSLRTPQTSLQYKLYKAKKRFASSPASQPDERASFCRRAANSTVCHILYPLRLFFCKYKQVYIINKIFHRQSDGKKGLERRPTFSEPLRAHSAIRPKKAQLCIQPVIVRKATLSRCFLRCRPPAPTETIGFPVRQQSGTKRCRKPQETIPTHPPESDDTKIRPFPRSDYKKTQVQRCTTRHPTRFWFKVGKWTFWPLR